VSALTFDEAAAEVAGKTRLTVRDVYDLRAVWEQDLADDKARDAEGQPTMLRLTLLIQTYRDADLMPERSNWEVFLEVMGKVVQVAGFISPIAGAVGSVFGAVKTLTG